MSRRGRRVGLATGYLLGAAGACSPSSPASSTRCCSCWSARPCSARARPPTAARATPPPTSRRRDRRPGAVDGRVGDHDRCRRRARTSPGRPARLADAARDPGADRAVRAGARRDAAGGARGRRPAAPRPAAARPRGGRGGGGRHDRGRGAAPPSWRRTAAAVRARPVLGAGGGRPRRRARGDGRGDGHDAAAHGARRRRAADHRHRHQRHVLGMFAFSPLVGWLADRVGRAAVLAPAAWSCWSRWRCAAARPRAARQIFAGLFLLGLGWSFATVAASTMIADHAPLEARTDVQGTADLVMGLTAAAAGGLAGLSSAPSATRPSPRRPPRWRSSCSSRRSRRPGCAERPADGAAMSVTVADIGRHRRHRLLLVPRRRRAARRRHAVRRPSAPVAVGTVAGRRVAFLPRHGAAHEYPPHRINYRANLWALRSLGVRQVLAPCAVGGLRAGGRAGRRRRARPAGRPHPRPGAVVRRDRRRAPALRRPLLRRTRPPSPRPTGRSAGRRHHGRHRGPAVLHARRVAALRRPGLVPDQHDRRTPRRCWPARCAVLRRDRARHRHGRRGRGRRRGRARRRSSRSSRRTSTGSAGCSPTPSPPCRPGRLHLLDLGGRHRAHLRDPVLRGRRTGPCPEHHLRVSSRCYLLSADKTLSGRDNSR